MFGDIRGRTDFILIPYFYPEAAGSHASGLLIPG